MARLPGQVGSGEGESGRRPSYLAIALLVPILGASLGVNGGAIFQIVALENLGLDASQIGLAVGLGAVSIPFQIWAARIPLRRAHQNLRLFVVTMALLCWTMAWLVLKPFSASFLIVAAIAIAVVAEVAVSVLFATSWQPLLSTTVTQAFRQKLNAQGRAAGNVMLIGLVAVVGVVGSGGRIAVLIGIGCLGFLMLPAVNRLHSVTAGTASDHAAGSEGETSQVARSVSSPGSTVSALSKEIVLIYLAIALSVIPAWPFFLTYAANVFWPSVNLGLVGAALTVGSLVVAAGWRPTETRLVARAKGGAIVLLGCAAALIPIGRPVSGPAAGLTVLAVVVLAAGSGTAVRIALLEMLHLRTTPSISVKVLTILDVIASTTMQIGFLAAGYFIDASAASTWPVDPYQLSLLVPALFLLLVVVRLTPSQMANGDGGR